MARRENTTDAVKEYVEAHLTSDIDLKSLAANMGYSVVYIREMFALETGMPLKRYITRRRIANAAFDILYTQKSLTDISLDYGFDAYDTFTRAFRRVTGCIPTVFRIERPGMMRRGLGKGFYGVELTSERENSMEKNIVTNENSVVLYNVPRVSYGAFGGGTPYPISLKACANYLGEDIDYADSIVGCGAAFRFVWNTAFHDGGNVDICHTYQESDPLKVYVQGVTALGRSYGVLLREETTTRDEVKKFIVENINKGLPVIAMGMVGPPEAGIVAGYRDGGDTMLGWSVFQNEGDFKKMCEFDPCGYYITDKWWENGVDTLIAMGAKVCEAIGVESVVKRALEALEPRMDGTYAKGIAAYDAWIKDLNNDKVFPDPDSDMVVIYDTEYRKPMDVLSWQMMCVGDAIVCLHDGRNGAAQYFARRADDNAIYAQIAAAFEEASRSAGAMYDALGGWQRDEIRIRNMQKRETRDKIIALAKQAKAADERAYELLKRI